MREKREKLAGKPAGKSAGKSAGKPAGKSAEKSAEKRREGRKRPENRNLCFLLCFFAVYVFLCAMPGERVCAAEISESDNSLQEESQQKILEQFDFQELDEKLQEMFPEQKIEFGDVVEKLMSGDLMESGRTFLKFLSDQIFYEFRQNRENAVYLLLIAIVAAVFSNFSSAFQNRQASEISFYVLYMLMITLCLQAFRLAMSGVEEQLSLLLEFMKILCPSYFLAVAIASGSTSSLFFYNIVLFLIYIAEVLILNFLIPVINVYIMIQVLGNLTGENLLSQFSELIQKIVEWSLKTLIACVIGLNVVQGLLGPAVDTLKRSLLTKTAEAIPGIGNAIGGVTDIVLGTAVLIKNGIGMAGAVVALAICAVPILQMLLLAFLYKAVAAVVQPISDKRITSCIGSVSEGYELLVKVIVTTGVLFLLTIAVVAASTNTV